MNTDSNSILTGRKHSRDEGSIFTFNNSDMLTAPTSTTSHDDSNKFYADNRKKSVTSSNNSKGKDRKKSEGSICFLTEDGKYDKVNIYTYIHLLCCQ